MLAELPEEIFHEIMLYLKAINVLRLRLVCKLFRQRLDQESLWSKLKQRDLAPFLPQNHDLLSYRQIWLDLIRRQAEEIDVLSQGYSTRRISENYLHWVPRGLNLERFMQNERDLDTISAIIIHNTFKQNLYLLNIKVLCIYDHISRVPDSSIINALNAFQVSVQNIDRIHIKSNINHWPEDISQFHQLKSLILNNNNIKHIPNNIQTLNQLTKLSICDNQLSDLPDALFSLINLKILELNNNYNKTGGNHFETLPPAIGQLIQLENLNLQNTGLRSLPSEIGMLKNLKIIDLKKNKLTTLPSTLLSSNISILIYDNPLLNTDPFSPIAQRFPLEYWAHCINISIRQPAYSLHKMLNNIFIFPPINPQFNSIDFQV